MKLLIFLFAIIQSSFALAKPVCLKGTGEFPYFVYDTDSKLYLGKSGYSDLSLCAKAISTADPRMVCAPSGIEGGSQIFNTTDGLIIIYPTAYFTSVTFCSVAIASTRNGVVCVPHRNGFYPYDILSKKIYGEGSYSSMEFCRYSSLSASENDLFVCSLDRYGQPRVFNRSNNNYVSTSYLSTEECLLSIRGNK